MTRAGRMRRYSGLILISFKTAPHLSCSARMNAATGDRSYDVFNVATGDYITVGEIAALAAQVCGLDPARVQLDFTGGDRGWKGDVPVVRFDCSKIAALGWRCRRTSAEALRDSMAAMLDELRGAA